MCQHSGTLNLVYSTHAIFELKLFKKGSSAQDQWDKRFPFLEKNDKNQKKTKKTSKEQQAWSGPKRCVVYFDQLLGPVHIQTLVEILFWAFFNLFC